MTSFFVHIGAVLVSIGSAAAFAGPTQITLQKDGIEIHATFPQPNLNRQNVPSLPGLMLTMEGGLPSVPVQPVHVALPAGYTLNGIDSKLGKVTHFDGDIPRASSMAPISWRELPPRILKPANAPDFRGEHYPAERFQVSLQKLHGVTIALVNLYPLAANRNGGSELVASMDLRLNLKRTTEGDGPTPLFNHQRAEVKTFIANDEVLATYPTREGDARAYDYLILATPKVVAFQGTDGLPAFQASLTARGLTSKIVSLDTIDTTGTGPDRIEKIRAFIQAEHKDAGIRYVLLVGKSRASSSEPYFPARSMYSKIKAFFGGSSWVDLAEEIPADHYFAALDGTFNYNGNTKYGEPNDGDAGGDVDFLPEVAIGRVVVDSDQQLQQFVKKSVAAAAGGMPKQTLLAGEMLFKEMDLYGDEYMDQLVGECTEHTYTTSGYTADWQLKKLYDRKGGWTGSDALAAVNGTSFSMINHLGHSNNSTNFRMSTSSIARMKNAQAFFYYSQGCFAGAFQQGSFIDKLVTAPYAAFAAVGNSTYGLAPEDPQFDQTKTPGASQMLHRQFIHAIFYKGMTELGVAHQESKRAFIDLKSAQEIRWVNWGATFFGDPSLKLATN